MSTIHIKGVWGIFYCKGKNRGRGEMVKEAAETRKYITGEKEK